jgi:hypothetical protein
MQREQMGTEDRKKEKERKKQANKQNLKKYGRGGLSEEEGKRIREKENQRKRES